MQIQVNGQGQNTRPGTTVADLLRTLDIRPERVAVEVNLRVLDRADFERHALNDGDRVEILGFIGGGANHTSQIGAGYA